MSTFDLFNVKVNFRVFQCTCIKLSQNLKPVGCRTKQTDMWDSGAIVDHKCGIFDLLMFEGHIGVM